MSIWIAAIIIAFIAGVTGGWCARMHTRKDRAMTALVETYLAEKRKIETDVELATEELNKYRRELGARKGVSKK